MVIPSGDQNLTIEVGIFLIVTIYHGFVSSELGILHVKFAFCGTPVSQNVEITGKIPRYEICSIFGQDAAGLMSDV